MSGFGWKKLSKVAVLVVMTVGIFAVSACSGGRPDGYNPLVDPKHDSAMKK